MFGRKKSEVLVVGAGPVGLFTALVLARRGVPVEIIDREWRTGTRSYALALHAESLKLMEEFGLLNAVLERAYRVRNVGLYDHQRRRASLSLSDMAEDYSFVAVLRQDQLEALLENALKDAGVKVTWSHEANRLIQDGSGVRVSVDKLAKESLGYIIPHTEWIVTKTRDIEVPFVIGADGHRSRVRRALEIEYPEIGEPQDFAVFEFKTDTDMQDEMVLLKHEQTLNAGWPLPEGYCRWSFQVPRYDPAADARVKDRSIPQLDSAPRVLTDDRLRDLLAERAPWFTGSVDMIRWRMLIRFERRLADSFGRGRAWLAGDAGHLTGPAGIQSMNVGLREALTLGNTVAKVLKGEASAADLEAYGHGRRAEWRQLLGIDGGLKTTPDTDPWIAEWKDLLVPCVPASGDGLARLVGQVGLELP